MFGLTQKLYNSEQEPAVEAVGKNGSEDRLLGKDIHQSAFAGNGGHFRLEVEQPVEDSPSHSPRPVNLLTGLLYQAAHHLLHSETRTRQSQPWPTI